MEDKTYESPHCLLLRVELCSHILDASNESYTVSQFDDPFGEYEED